MKEWWNALSLRDKRVLSLGLFILIVIMLYEVIWNPLLTKNQLLRQQVQDNKKLIVWMRAAGKQIQSLEKKPINQSIKHSSLSILQEELKKSNLMGQISELKQAENNSVQLHFQAIYFDKLMSWLIKIYQEQGFVVSQIEVNSDSNVGRVSGQMVLKIS